MAFFQNPDEVTLAVGQGILDSPSTLTRQAIAVLCGDPEALAGFVTGYGTFVVGGIAGPALERSWYGLDASSTSLEQLSPRMIRDIVPDGGELVNIGNAPYTVAGIIRSQDWEL